MNQGLQILSRSELPTRQESLLNHEPKSTFQLAKKNKNTKRRKREKNN